MKSRLPLFSLRSREATFELTAILAQNTDVNERPGLASYETALSVRFWVL